LQGDGAVLVYRAFLCPAGAGGVPHASLPQLRFARVPIELEGGGGGAVDLHALPGRATTRRTRAHVWLVENVLQHRTPVPCSLSPPPSTSARAPASR